MIAEAIAGLRLYLLLILKGLRYVFYPTGVQWIQKPGSDKWDDLRLIFILNHTSLFEFVYAGVIPFRFLARMSRKLVFPVAEKTILNQYYGAILKTLAPHVISVSRRRDHTWKRFLDQLTTDTILIVMPEGRMKRPNGLDKHGGAMTVRGGALEILKKFSGEKALLVYSGGLHHVLPPNRYLPRIFKRIAVALEAVDIDTYLNALKKSKSGLPLRDLVARDLEARRDRYCPRL
jgi:hypothetical protein